MTCVSIQALETGDEDLHISSYGVSDSNLEEVFLEVTENANKDDEDKKSKQMKIFSTNQSASTDIPMEDSSPLADSGGEASGGQSETASQRSLGNAGAGNELELGNISELSASHGKARGAGSSIEGDHTVPVEDEERGNNK